MSLIFAAQLTAGATLALAILALATAVLAFMAWRKQSREVRDQAKMLKLQSDQLDEQRRINKLQAEDLRESLHERSRLREAAERQQADEIGFQMTTGQFPGVAEEEGHDFAVDPGDPVHTAIVSNDSRRPIENVACRIGGSPVIPGISGELFGRTRSEFAVLVGRLPDSGRPHGREMPVLIDLVPTCRGLRIRPGEEYAFVFEIDSHRALGLVPVVAVRFTDDAGLHWEIDRDQHLKRLADRDW